MTIRGDILFEQSDNAITEAFLQLCKERIDYFLLFLSRGEEVPYLDGVHKYVFDYRPFVSNGGLFFSSYLKSFPSGEDFGEAYTSSHHS